MLGVGFALLGVFVVVLVGLTGVVKVEGPATVPCGGSGGRPVKV